MKILLIDAFTGRATEAKILKATYHDMPLKKKGWNFTWRSLYKTEGALIYKLVCVDAPKEIEGLLMLTILYGEMLYMNNIEVAPTNYGSDGKYENVAGGLLAFACMKSFELGSGAYLGYLSFESKTKLINLYHEKYGAMQALNQKMYFGPSAGRRLMKQYLGIGTEEE